MRFQINRLMRILALFVWPVAATSWSTGHNVYLALIVWAPLFAILLFSAAAVGNWIDRRFSKPVNSEDPVWRRITQALFLLAFLPFIAIGISLVGWLLIELAESRWANH